MIAEYQKYSSKIEKAWADFMACGETNVAIRAEIKASWRRCRELGVDPYGGRSDTLLGEADFNVLKMRKQPLIDIMDHFMARFYALISSSEVGIVLTDEEGYILKLYCTAKMQELVVKSDLNYLPGYRWQEEDVGTNGISLALQLQRPFQIAGAEHYAFVQRANSCVVAPIFSADGRLIGSLCATGPADAVSKHTLAMMVAVVEAITHAITVQGKNRLLTITNNRLTNVLMSMSDGVLVTDEEGRIEQINPVAQRLLGNTEGYINKKTLSIFYKEAKAYTSFVLKEGKSYSSIEIAIKTENSQFTTLVSANPIRDEQQRIVGGVIVLTPQEKMQKLIRRYASTQAKFRFEDIIGHHPKIRSAVALAEKAARSFSNVLLGGESGTGKEVFAQAIHNGSKRAKGSFVAINCGALPRELISSELFGYAEGAFTGAKKEGKPGKFELANGGTIFLDEIGDMPLDLQVNLLRVLQERKISRIGSLSEIPIDVRVICATNKNLLEELKKGTFRQDLYYRLNVISIRIPALRERVDDIPELFRFFIRIMSDRETASKLIVDSLAMECLKQYDWPGNVREMQNIVERMVMLMDENFLGTEHLPAEIFTPTIVGQLRGTISDAKANYLQRTRTSGKEDTTDEERRQLLTLLTRYKGNISKVSKELKVARCTIYRRMKRCGIAEERT